MRNLWVDHLRNSVRWLWVGALLIGATLVVRDPQKTYPFNLGVSFSPEHRQVYGAMRTVERALNHYILHTGQAPGTIEEFLRSPSGAWLAPMNPYTLKPARIVMGASEGWAVSDGDLVIVTNPRENRSWAGFELRAYAKGLGEATPYFRKFVPAANRPQAVGEAVARQDERLKGLTAEERQVEAYAHVLWSCAEAAVHSKVPGYKESFGGISSLADLKEIWWECAPSAIRNPFTQRPVREVPLTEPSPGEVTFLPVQLNLEVATRYRGSLEDRPASYPRSVVVIGWGADRKPVDPALLVYAMKFRPADMAPLPPSIVKEYLPE